MKYDLSLFEKLVDQGYLRKSENDSLILYGYTDKCTFERYWTPLTRIARGLILEKSTGKVIAKPLEKFYNLGEMEETFLSNLPNTTYRVQEKVDGSLGIIYFYDKIWRVATRGSLNSEQAIRGAKILEKYNTQFLHQGFTYLAEIIYPENKIIVNYGDEEKLVLLAAFHNTTGKEVGPYHLSTVAHMLNMPCAEEYEYSIEEMIELQKTLPKDQEGFVVRFENGLRVKIKGNEYSRIAKIISHMSPLSFWEVMKNGLVNNLYLQQLPEEFRTEFEKIINDLEMSYFRVMKEILLESDLLPSKDWSTHESRRDISIFIQQSNMKHKAAMFSVLNQDKNALNKYVMKLIRPTGNVIKGLE